MGQVPLSLIGVPAWLSGFTGLLFGVITQFTKKGTASRYRGAAFCLSCTEYFPENLIDKLGGILSIAQKVVRVYAVCVRVPAVTYQLLEVSSPLAATLLPTQRCDASHMPWYVVCRYSCSNISNACILPSSLTSVNP